MSAVDLMAIAIEWLDAYRAGDLFIVDFYADDASLQCDCAGKTETRGLHAIASYWRQRLVGKPAGELIDLQWDSSDVVLHFRVSDEIVEAVLTFNPDGSLRRSRCGLFNHQVPTTA